MFVISTTQDHAMVKDTEIAPTLPAGMGDGGGYDADDSDSA